ncbi:tail fiber domain-containing protein [Xanthomarina sp. F2636L]|uniref:tail fiber domain-containing protein n=1 Tax=Xanthomarina sp. F2636L TaxID=2996018 RepID=UPI00225E3C1A|nr:tail fiber domain-containing protein [Xanthomarina sp. F2636L]MCX7550476.1 tail fiber domain-containing protein [Xanthomarina sp. F2636L]
MKNLFLLLALSISFLTYAQQGINYKALVKDGSGNVVANDLIQVQFSVLQGVAQTNVYQETHTPTTDANGLIIVNIGEGTTSEVFTDINWAADEHFLNVQIDTGSGLTDMGTTQFMAVPYALQAENAANVTGLEALDEGNGVGWRLIGSNSAYYDNIGENAVDLSIGSSGGAEGASGELATSLGSGTKADSYASTALGSYNVGGGDPTAWVSTDPLFEIGNGVSPFFRFNALSILKNGTITAPSFDISEITDNKALITKEYADTNLAPSGLEALDEGNGTGYRIVGRDPVNYGNIGLNAVDLSYSSQATEFNGAFGQNSTAIGRNTSAGEYSTAMGFNTDASGEYSTAIGNFTDASGEYSTAMGYYVNAESFRSTAIGSRNIGGGSPTGWVAADPLFEIGNGLNTSSNALTILKNGTITAPSFDIAEITDDKALITKEYADTNLTASGLEVLTEGANSGYRLIGKNPSFYGNIGNQAVDLSFNNTSSSILGATGSYSLAIGYKNTASGLVSTALGSGTLASSNYATAMGINTVASGLYSTALGFDTNATGDASTSIGYNTVASGEASTAMGYNTKATAYASTVIGSYNTGSGNATSWIATDPLFIIGNGTSNSNKSNALTVLKNGHIGIDKSSFVNAKLDIDHASSQTSPQINIRETSGDYARLSFSNSSFIPGYWTIAGSISQTPSTDRLNFYHSAAGDIMSIVGNGSVLVNGSVVHSSDFRLKSDIETIPYGLNEVLQLQPKAYHWKAKPDQENKSLGLIAQDVKSIINEIVHTADDEDKTLSVSYTELIPVLIKAIQEQQDIIDNQNLKLNKQDHTINGLTAELKKKADTQKLFNQRLEKLEAQITINNP